jgi:hypothetical protein
MENKDKDAEKYYAIIKERLEKQLGNVDIYNSKANALIVTSGVLIVIFWELINKIHSLAGIGLPLIVVAMTILLWAYRIVDWQDTPNPEYIFSEYKDQVPAYKLYEDMMADMIECYKENKTNINKKAKRINCASLLLFLGIGLSLVGLIICPFL